ncbi:MAG TPA: fibronectin type III domain-containing protein [bacterium]|nr:fibronectin type III domain-containing protein [bacterium]
MRASKQRHPAGVAILLVLLAWFLAAGTAFGQTPPAPSPATADSAAAFAPSDSSAPPPAPPANVAASDAPSDGGGAVVVRWDLSPDDGAAHLVESYRVLRSENGTDFKEVGTVLAGSSTFRDSTTDGVSYQYKVVAKGPGGEGESESSAGMSSSGQWFNGERWNLLVILLLVCGAILFWIWRATTGQMPYIRRIAGMDAVTEAVGRATEMGKPVLYIAGIQDMDNVQTVAGLTILGSISKLIAQYETHLLMPTSRSLVMSTARETVKEAYLSAGRPDAFREDSIYYVTDEQFGFVAHVDGIMVRRRPAACFYLGAFFAESLILAETGNSIGAIQIAGTAMPTQLPFFVAACDYTLIGEELFAASAYLSRDEKMLGSLKGQDWGKVIAMLFILIGSIVTTFAQGPGTGPADQIAAFLHRLWTGATVGGG